MNEDIACVFCNKPSTGFVCDDSECKKEYDAINENVNEVSKKELKSGFKKAFTERAKCEDNYYLNRAQRWFYTFKCVVCVTIKRHRPASAGSHPETIRVSTIYLNGTWPSNWDAAWLRVGHGVLKQWWYDILEDGEFVY